MKDWNETIKDYYKRQLWNREQVEMAVALGKITREEADAILNG